MPARRLGPLAGVIVSGVAWAVLLVLRGPPTRPAAVLGAVVLAAVGTATVGLLARSLFGPAAAGRGRWIAAMGPPVAAVAVLGLVLPSDLSPRAGLLVGLAPVAAVAVGTALAGPDPARVRRFAIALGLWALALLGYWLLVDREPVGTLVWERADQVRYHVLGVKMLQGHLDDFRYMLGLPALLTPYDLLAGVQDGSWAASNATNVVILPTFALLIGPVTVLAAGEAIVGVLRRTDERALAISIALVTAGLLAYVRFAPAWVPDYNAELVPRRLLGLVFAPEPLTAAFLAGALWLLVRSGEPGPVGWDPIAVGASAGFVVLLREPNAALVALVFVLALRNRDLFARVLAAAVVAGAVVAVQMATWLITYGGIGAPNRAEQWAQPNRVRRWTNIARARYGFEGRGPPRVSWDWAPTNLREVVPPYTLPLLVLAVLSVVAALRHPRHWRLWVFSAVFCAGTVLFNASYINVEVLFRYNSIVVLPLLVAGVIGLGSLRRSGRG